MILPLNREIIDVGFPIKVLDRWHAENSVQDRPYDHISITGRNMWECALPPDENRKSLLRLEFDDVLLESKGAEHEHIRATLKFFAERDPRNLLVVNCDAGMSRSAAVAAALTTIAGFDSYEFFRQFRPNPAVYAMLLKVYNENKLLPVIPRSKCVKDKIYVLKSRNLELGIYDEVVGGFTGIREKFGHYYLFMEYHVDNGVAGMGTARPYYELGYYPWSTDQRDEKKAFELLEMLEKVRGS